MRIPREIDRFGGPGPILHLQMPSAANSLRTGGVACDSLARPDLTHRLGLPRALPGKARRTSNRMPVSVSDVRRPHGWPSCSRLPAILIDLATQEGGRRVLRRSLRVLLRGRRRSRGERRSVAKEHGVFRRGAEFVGQGADSSGAGAGDERYPPIFEARQIKRYRESGRSRRLSLTN